MDRRLASLWAVLAVLGCGRTDYFAESQGDGNADGDAGDDDDGGRPGLTATGTGGSASASASVSVSASITITDSATGPDSDTGTTGIEVVDDTGTTGELTCADAPHLCAVHLNLRRAVDILFVLDNSGSMGGEQGTLASSFGSFVDVLEAQEVGANYRIGVTTSAGDGVLRATSCRSRLWEFVFEWSFGTVDERQRGCLDNCNIEEITLAEPWVEKTDGSTNLPPGLSMTEVLQCIGPQGIIGPGFERPLESMRNALLDVSSDFVRDDALLAVIFVTDEADCSMDPVTENWIRTEGDVFWTDPTRATSAVCWNAGVECEGGPGVFENCWAEDHAMDGEPTDDPEEAILYPTERYVDTLSDIAEQKQLAGGQGEVLLGLIAGVPLDYHLGGQIPWADSPNEEFQLEFGIGPGCGLGTETIQNPPGIPPVRMRELVEDFQTDTPNVFSVCNDDYAIALTDIANKLGELDERACLNGCVTDLDPDTEELEPDCILGETFADGSPGIAVPPCIVGDDFWDFPNEFQHICYRALTDPDMSTVTPHDDMSPQCVTLDSNLEYVIERREGVPVAAGTSVEVHCTLVAPIGTGCDEV